MGNNFGRIDAKKHRSKVFNVEKINNLSILYGTATFSAVFSLIMDVKSDTLPSLKHIAKTILRGCKGQKICYNSDIYHHNYNGEFMKKIFGFTRLENAAHVDTSNKQCKAAFTLAEVLITLGIIGVVAAMTMPSLINNYRKQQVVAQLKKSYSVLEQTIKRAEVDYGPANDWPEWNDAEAILHKYFVPYLSGAKEFGKAQSWGTAMCYDGTSKTNTSTAYSGHEYNWLENTHISTPFYANKTASIKLADGICIGLNPDLGNHHSKFFMIDVNGSQNGPNVGGKDLFFYYINSSGFVKPYGDTWSVDDLKDASVTNACNQSASLGGVVCAARIMAEGWEINYWN